MPPDHQNHLGHILSIASLLGGGGDVNRAFPNSDADDMSSGARWIPGDVTLARRRGELVRFVRTCGRCCWYWEFPAGHRIYHWDSIANRVIVERDVHDANGVLCCPGCTNVHINGGFFFKQEIGRKTHSAHRHILSVLIDAILGDPDALETLRNTEGCYEAMEEFKAALTDDDVADFVREKEGFYARQALGRQLIRSIGLDGLEMQINIDGFNSLLDEDHDTPED